MEKRKPKVSFIQDWLKEIEDQIVPPFCVELVLSDHSRYYLHSICLTEEDTNTAIIRVWDIRAMSEQDIENLKIKLNSIQKREDLGETRNIHPKLDWANLRINLQDIIFCFEWHDRLWPEEERPSIGFTSPSKKRNKNT